MQVQVQVLSTNDIFEPPTVTSGASKNFLGSLSLAIFYGLHKLFYNSTTVNETDGRTDSRPTTPHVIMH